jgi:hypothetical protein
MIKPLSSLPKRCARWRAHFRLATNRYPHPAAIGIAALFLAVLVAGILIGAYWTYLAVFIRVKGLGELTFKFLPVAGAIGGIVVFWWQVSRARYNQRIDLILKLSERFDKSEMRAARAKAARALRADRKTEDGAVDDVIGFFEDVGFLLDRNAIDVESVYEFFEYWAVPYHQVTEYWRERERDETGFLDLYSNLDKLVNALTDLEMARKGQSPSRTDDLLDEFLAEESKLVQKTKSPVAHNVSRQHTTIQFRR